MYKFLTVFFILFIPLTSYSIETLHCHSVASSSITFDTKDNTIEADGNVKDDKEFKITFAIEEKVATLIGNATVEKLARVGNSFIEDTGTNIILWKLEESKGVKYLFSMKAYSLSVPSSFTTLYKCKE